MLRSFLQLIRDCMALALPYGRLRLAATLAVILGNGLMQVVGVASVFPFFALAADPERIQRSQFGSAILAFLPEMDHRTLLIASGLASVALLFAANASSLAGEVIRTRYGHGLGHFLRIAMLESLAARPYGYFLERNSGALMQKLLGDVGQFIHGVLLPLLECLTRLVTLGLLLLTIFLVQPLIALGAALGLGGFYATVFLQLRHRARRLGEGLQTANAGTYVAAQQFFGGIKPILVHGLGARFIQAFKRHSAAQARIQPLVPLFSNSPRYLIEPLALGALIAVILFYLLQGRPLDDILPNLTVIAFAAYRMLPSFQMLYGQITQIQAVRYVVRELQAEFPPQPPAPRTDLPTAPLPFERTIEFRAVTFHYPSAPAPVLDRFSLTIRKNAAIGIAGPSGAGKSTLVDLLLGLHTPQSGEILIDNQALTPEHLPAWRRLIGYVPQDIYLLDASIAENIAFGIPPEEIDPAALREAADAAQITAFIENELPQQWNTLVGERGVRLSGGQRQRLSLARALYHKPQVLILDEATSALDTATESEVMKAIHRLHGRLTLIAIAHRLTTLEECDEILQLTPTPPR